MSLLSWICLAPREPQVVSRSPNAEAPPAARQQKWLPVIDTDNCIGCERCVAACEHGCLEMVWSFSTLTRPHDCGGEGHCVEACPEQIIRMAWVPLESRAPIRVRSASAG
jgi:NAD-dependent dihydropyrimidine dehydrogenase PreA subunit